MKAFTESPFLFFVDNASPIFSLDSRDSDTRKIVELSDAGCDARTPLITRSQNPDQHYHSKAPKMKSKEAWKIYREQTGNKIKSNRFREQDELHFTPNEDENCLQHHHLQKESTYRGDKPRSRRWNREESYRTLQGYQNEPKMATDHHQEFQNRKGSKLIPEHSQYIHSRYSQVNHKLYREDTIDRDPMRPLEDYPEDFSSIEASRHSSRGKDNWQRSSIYDSSNRVDEKDRRSSRISSKSPKAPSSARPNDPARSEEARASRIRSRTCSPPADRRKRTRSFVKSNQQNPQQPDIDVESVHHENFSSSDRSNRLIDRAVDKDSLSDVLSGSGHPTNSTDPSTIDAEEKKPGTGFWEFIPLEDDQKCRKIPGKFLLNFGRQTVRKSPNHSSALPASNKNLGLSGMKTKTPVEAAEAKFAANLETSRIQKELEFVEKLRRETSYLKRPSSPTKSQANDKKKMLVDNGARKSSFVEKTAACLKRKLDRSKLEETRNRPSTMAEKKVRSEDSRLPIRIGSRLRSKNPVSWRVRSKDGSKNVTGASEDSTGISSVRSRTKPKIRPSIELNRALVDPVEGLGHQTSVELENRYQKVQTGDSKLIENDYMENRRNLLRNKELKDKRLDVSADSKMLKTELDVKAGVLDQRQGFKDKCFFRLNDEQNVICNHFCAGREHRDIRRRP